MTTLERKGKSTGKPRFMACISFPETLRRDEKPVTTEDTARHRAFVRMVENHHFQTPSFQNEKSRSVNHSSSLRMRNDVLLDRHSASQAASTITLRR
jgi:hypothetical protein